MTTSVTITRALLGELARRRVGPTGPLTPFTDVADLAAPADTAEQLVALGVLDGNGGIAGQWRDALDVLADPASVVEIDVITSNAGVRLSRYRGASDVTIVRDGDEVTLAVGTARGGMRDWLGEITGRSRLIGMPIDLVLTTSEASTLAGLAGPEVAALLGEIAEGAAPVADDGTLAPIAGALTARMPTFERLIRLRRVDQAGGALAMARSSCLQSGVHDLLLVEEDDDGVRLSTVSGAQLGAYAEALLGEERERDASPSSPTTPIAAVAAPRPLPSAVPRRRGRVRGALSLLALVVGLGSSGLGLYRVLDADDSASTAQPQDVATTTTSIDDEPVADDTVLEDGDAGAAFETCSNDVYGWEVEYPAEYFVGAGGAAEQDCAYFDDQPIEALGDEPETAVIVRPSEVSYDETVDAFRSADNVEVGDVVQTIVAGNDATRMEATLADGEDVVLYVFQVNGSVFYAGAASSLADDFDTAVFVLDQVMASMR